MDLSRGRCARHSRGSQYRFNPFAKLLSFRPDLRIALQAFGAPECLHLGIRSALAFVPPISRVHGDALAKIVKALAAGHGLSGTCAMPLASADLLFLGGVAGHRNACRRTELSEHCWVHTGRRADHLVCRSVALHLLIAIVHSDASLWTEFA